MDSLDFLSIQKSEIWGRERVGPMATSVPRLDCGYALDVHPRHQSVHLPGGYLIGDLVRLIDEFYSDQANIRLPILDGVVWATMQLKGSSEAELKQTVEQWRKVFSSTPAPASKKD
jgi:hypothetical protein